MSTSAKEQFNRQAAHYDNQWASWSDAALQTLLEWANPQPHWHALDAATGTGYTALALAPYVAQVVGTDIATGMLVQAENHAREQNICNVQWQEAPAERMPFAEASFDLVTVRIAPHHFQDVPAFLAEVRRVLRPGGVFVLCDTTVPEDNAAVAAWQNAVERLRDTSHVANLDERTWRALAEDAGLRLDAAQTESGHIILALTHWLSIAGCDGERAARVREMFAKAPAEARAAFHITTDSAGETQFAWQRVLLRAYKEDK